MTKKTPNTVGVEDPNTQADPGDKKGIKGRAVDGKTAAPNKAIAMACKIDCFFPGGASKFFAETAPKIQNLISPTPSLMEGLEAEDSLKFGNGS